MISNQIIAAKIQMSLNQSKLNRTHLVSCCREILDNFKFDSVFLCHSPSPEAELKKIAFEGKEEIMDACIYRLGVEERLALTRLSYKTYTDITGKPLFNKSGSLRIQKPNSGIYLVHFQPNKDFLIFGCAHQEPRTYDSSILNDLISVWNSTKEGLCDAARKVQGLPADNIKNSSPNPPAQTTQTNLDLKLPAPPSSPLKNKHRKPALLVDEVTKLFNKDYFEDCLAIEVERAKRYSRNLSLLFLSVTPLSQTAQNENEIALQISEILSLSLRRVDVICRLEKNKYALILPDTSTSTYGTIAKRIFKHFKEVMGATPPVFINVSASSYPKHADNHLSLLQNTEKLLTQARTAGPNKAVLPE